jgi:hypothetical protein
MNFSQINQDLICSESMRSLYCELHKNRPHFALFPIVFRGSSHSMQIEFHVHGDGDGDDDDDDDARGTTIVYLPKQTNETNHDDI